MTEDILLIGTNERVRTLTLNRPQARNALSSALRDRFFSALTDAGTDDDVGVIIVTGTDPVFCAGLDLKELGGQSALPDISPRWPPRGCGWKRRRPGNSGPAATTSPPTARRCCDGAGPRCVSRRWAR